MLYNNYAIEVKRDLLTRIIKLLRNNNLVEGIRSIPVEIRPSGSNASRCCVHKDRYMVRHKLISIMGFDLAFDDDIDLMSVSNLAQAALDDKKLKQNILSVVYEACSACQQSQYTVTNVCRGCVGRPCMMNCPKHAISFANGRAYIRHEDCVNCGLCAKVCPYHSIVYTPVPCEDVCPVKAITKDERGVEHIDKNKCIYCGKCMQACPYGAIMERSRIIEIYKALSDPKRKTIAIPAPAIFGQFNATPGQILTAIRGLGFNNVIEVALGADITVANEGAELLERLKEGAPFMTTSCCPAYTGWVEKHAPELKPFVSHTKSPMVYAARKAKERYPGADVVFIGPCLAKRWEFENVDEIDYVMSFEELGAFFDAYDIKVNECKEKPLNRDISSHARGFAMAGGVRDAVLNYLGDDAQGVKTLNVEGLDKKSGTLLRGLVKSSDYQFVEVMACEGGCLNGPCSLVPLSAARRQMKKMTN